MVQMICPVCKNNCHLEVEEIDGVITVSGNKCARGDLHVDVVIDSDELENL